MRYTHPVTGMRVCVRRSFSNGKQSREVAERVAISLCTETSACMTCMPLGFEIGEIYLILIVSIGDDVRDLDNFQP